MHTGAKGGDPGGGAEWAGGRGSLDCNARRHLEPSRQHRGGWDWSSEQWPGWDLWICNTSVLLRTRRMKDPPRRSLEKRGGTGANPRHSPLWHGTRQQSWRSRETVSWGCDEPHRRPTRGARKEGWQHTALGTLTRGSGEVEGWPTSHKKASEAGPKCSFHLWN